MKKESFNKMTLKGGYVKVKIDNIHEHLQEIQRGAGVTQSRKTYNRKKNNRNDDYDCSFLFI